MHIEVDILKLDFDWQGYLNALDIVLQTQLRQAARAWLRAVLIKVPVWTGESRGSLQPIGQFLRVAVPASPSATAPADRQSLGQSEQIFNFQTVGGIYRFSWETHVPHYLINEYYQSGLPLIEPTPWHSLQAGETAFYNYVNNVLPLHLPHVASFIKIKIRR